MTFSDDWGFDYSLASVIETQNKKPNASCTVDGKFYDIQNCVARIKALEAKVKAADELAKRSADCISYMDVREKIAPGMPRVVDVAKSALTAYRNAEVPE